LGEADGYPNLKVLNPELEPTRGGRRRTGAIMTGKFAAASHLGGAAAVQVVIAGCWPVNAGLTRHPVPAWHQCRISSQANC